MQTQFTRVAGADIVMKSSFCRYSIEERGHKVCSHCEFAHAFNGFHAGLFRANTDQLSSPHILESSAPFHMACSLLRGWRVPRIPSTRVSEVKA